MQIDSTGLDPKVNPKAAVFLAVAAVSTASILIKLASNLPALTVVAYRLGLTLIILLPFALVFNRKEIARLGRWEMLLALVSGSFLALHFLTWTYSLYYTTVSSSAILVNTHPVFVMLGSALFLREGIGWKKVLFALLAVGGTIIIGYNDFSLAGGAFTGDILALTGALFLTGYLLIGRYLRERLSLLPYVIVVYGFCEAIILLSALVTGTSLNPGSSYTLGILLLLALIPTILGHTVFNWSLKYLPSPMVAISLLGEPVGASILALLVFREIPSPGQLLGGMVILLGLYLFARVE